MMFDDTVIQLEHACKYMQSSRAVGLSSCVFPLMSYWT